MRKILTLSRVVAVCSLGVFAVACGSDDTASDSTMSGATSDAPSDAPSATSGGSTTAATDGELPAIAVTTSILGDIVSEAVGDLAEVEVIMPIGADPHDFAPSAKQAEAMENADLLVINGAGFEEGMLATIEQVESSGTPVFAFADQIELLEFDGEHSDDEEHSDEVAFDPHIWTDPTRMITAVEAFGDEFAGVDGVDGAAVKSQVRDYIEELTVLDSEMEDTLATVPDDQRVLVTSHEVFGYFADRFDFKIVGAVLPSLTTNAEPSAADIEELAALIEAEGIPAIFGDTSGSTQLAEALAESVGSDVEVVVLYSESLGEPGSGADTYIGMMNTNAELISGALTPS
ncbi:MAG TPA: metal ABC transporter substrate-binding protein [Ilumatobacteraceae bacterium]|nr:metal ABC transporter substrate-binding protein [Ilumatobacteraceae bacterium]